MRDQDLQTKAQALRSAESETYDKHSSTSSWGKVQILRVAFLPILSLMSFSPAQARHKMDKTNCASKMLLLCIPVQERPCFQVAAHTTVVDRLVVVD